jgi:hypothetical protein
LFLSNVDFWPPALASLTLAIRYSVQPPRHTLARCVPGVGRSMTSISVGDAIQLTLADRGGQAAPVLV